MQFSLIWNDSDKPEGIIDATNIKKLASVLRNDYSVSGLVDVYYNGKVIGSLQTHVHHYWQWAVVSSKLSPAIFQFFDMDEHWPYIPASKLRKRTNPYLEVL